MKLSQISYQRVYPLGSYSTERIGLEATLDEGENPETALSHLKILVEELHQETLKSLPTDDFRGTHVRNVVEEPQDKIERTMIEEMEACSSYPEIQSFRFTIKDADEQAVYDRKLNELSPKNQ
jgi:hypothetical protein